LRPEGCRWGLGEENSEAPSYQLGGLEERCKIASGSAERSPGCLKLFLSSLTDFRSATATDVSQILISVASVAQRMSVNAVN